MATAQQVNAWDEKGNPVDPAGGATAWDEKGNPIPVTASREPNPEEAQAQTKIRNVIQPTTNPVAARLEHIATHQRFPASEKEIEQGSTNAAKFGADMMMGNVVGGPLARLAETHVIPALKAVPWVGRAVTAIDEAPTVLGKVARGATVGGVTGGVEGLIRGRGIEGSAEEAGKGALFGGALGLALPAVSRLARVRTAAPEVPPIRETPFAPEPAAPAPAERLQPVGGQSEDALEAARRGAPGVNPIQRSVDRHFEKARSPRGYFNPGRPGETVKLDDVVNQATGVKPLKPDVPLRDQLSKVTVGEPTEIDPIKAKYPEPQVRQMVRANGERIYEAAKGSPETVKAIHDLTRVELRQALINSGEDMGQTTVSNSKFAGEGSIPREEAFNKLLDKKLSPEKIVELAKKPIEAESSAMPEPKASTVPAKRATRERASNIRAARVAQ